MKLRCRYAGFVFLLVPLADSLRADVTVRYRVDLQTSPVIPMAAVDQALMRDMVIRIKGNKAYASQGNLISIVDLKTQDLVLVDAANKRFAAIPAGQFDRQLKAASPGNSPVATALASMKTNFESHSTGRTAAIQGVQADEQELVLTADMALPGGPPQTGPLLKMVMHVWTAQPEETQRVPALQEFRNYTASASSALNPTDSIKQVLSALPGLGDSLGAMTEELTKKGALTLRTHMELFMPFLAMMGQQLPGQAPATLDPNGPLMQMTQEVVELSTALLDDALFEIPADYQQSSVEEILKGAVSRSAPPQFKP